MRLLRLATFFVIALTVLPGAGFAQSRVALVIGNSAYQNQTALRNPVTDANDMSAALRRLSRWPAAGVIRVTVARRWGTQPQGDPHEDQSAAGQRSRRSRPGDVHEPAAVCMSRACAGPRANGGAP